MLKMIIIVIGAAIIMILLLVVRKQKKLIDFMSTENKKRRSQNVQWNTSDQEQLSMIRKRVEYTVLQSQINPHFLYNTLESIRSRALQDDNQEIASMTEILSKFFRYCISNGERLIQLREEINHIKNYYFIQKYRFEERINMEFEIEDEALYELYIPKMSLQPLVENAMIHGLEKISRAGTITVRLQGTQQKVILTVEDNGAGMDVEALDSLNSRLLSVYVSAGSGKGRHGGVALTNVNSRLKLGFGEEYGIHYRSVKDRGTQAVMTLPRIDEFERIKYSGIFRTAEQL